MPLWLVENAAPRARSAQLPQLQLAIAHANGRGSGARGGSLEPAAILTNSAVAQKKEKIAVECAERGFFFASGCGRGRLVRERDVCEC